MKAITKVGISITSSEVSFVVLQKGEHFLVLDQGQHPLKDLAAILKYIKKSADFICHLALPHTYMSINHLVFAESFTETEVYELLTLNPSQYFPLPLEAIFFDYALTGKVRNKARVLACKREYVHQYQRQFDQAGLKLKLITADIIAIEQFLAYQQLISENEVYAIFVLSNNELIQIVLVEEQAFFTHTCVVHELNKHIISQEVLQFFKIYESSNSFRLPITQIIFLGFDDPFLSPKSFFSLPSITQPDSSLVIAQGVVLSC